MNRRQFLTRAVPSAAALALAADALWTPERTIFLPPLRGWFSADQGRFACAGDSLLINGKRWMIATEARMYYLPPYLELRKLGFV